MIRNNLGVDTKECTKCGVVKALTEYGPHKLGKFGKKSRCNQCLAKEAAEWRKNNPKRHAENQRRLYHANPARVLNYNKEYRKLKPEKKRLQDGVRLARKRCLPASKVREVGRFCELTGRINEVTLEHWIPLSTGHGGTIHGNIYSILGPLNYSKRDANPFEWFEANGQRFELSKSTFDSLVAKLAEQNGLTPEEFRDFTYWCFANKRTIEQVSADNLRYGYKKPSIEIWRDEMGIAFPIRIDFGDLSLDHTQEMEEIAA